MSDATPTFVQRIRVPLGFIAAAAYLFFGQPRLWTILVSLVLVLPGLALRAYSAGYIRKNTELTQTGPYAYTRNPLYLGSLLMVVGFGFAAGSWSMSTLLTAVFLTIYLPTIAAEEQHLRTTFAGFDAYAARVPRLLPRLSAASGPEGATAFSAERYRAHREYNALIGVVAIYLALAVKLYIAYLKHDSW
jgi:hypothetical protein